MPKAYSYQRFSTPEQSKGDSLRRQSDLAESYCLQHGLELVESYTDLGVSAFRGKNVTTVHRLGAFLEDVKAGRVPQNSYLLVESLDRLSRDHAFYAADTLKDICKAGVSVVTLADGKLYSVESLIADPYSIIMLTLIFIRANEESETKSKRGRANWQQKRVKAISEPLTAKLPAWCRMVTNANGRRERIELIPERAEIVKGMFADYLAGVGQVTIAKRLNIAQVPCWGRASMWHTSYISKILSSPSVMGVYVPHLLIGGKGGKRIEQEPVHNYFPVIVSEQDFNRVQSMRKIGCFAGQKQEVHNVLSNLAKCPLCGSTMRRIRNGARARAKLICVKAKAGAGCMGYGVDYQQLEAVLIAGIPHISFKVPSITKQQKAIAELQATIDKHKTLLGNVMQAIQAGQQTPDADIFGGSTDIPVTMLQAVQLLEGKLKTEETELVKLQQQLSLVRGDSVRDRLRELKRLAVASELDRGAVNALLLELCSKVGVDYVVGEIQLIFRAGGKYNIPMPEAPEVVRNKAMLMITGQLDAAETI